jgi:hypothetical protein
LLTGGDWGQLNLRGQAWPDDRPLVLRAADPSDPPRFSDMLVADTRNLVLEGLVFDYVFSPGDPPHFRPFRIEGSQGIVIRESLFDGDDARTNRQVTDGFPTAFGLGIQGSSSIVLEGSEIRGFGRGLVVSASRDIIIRGNDLHHLRTDGMDFAQVERVLIESNHIHDFDRSLGSRDHADMIQFWTRGTNAPTRDVTIRGNLLNSGRGWYTQSIFMRNDQVDRRLAGPEMFYRDVTIEGNFILNAHLHGITVGATMNLSILNNTVVRNSASGGPDHDRGLSTPQIRVAPGSTNVRIIGNVVARIEGSQGRPDWVIADNFLVQDRSRTEPGYYGLVFAGGDPTLPSSYVPRPGGPLDGAGIGAQLRGPAR